jgi:Tol biopolymer transport system component
MRRLLPFLLAVPAALVLAAPAGATIVFSRYAKTPSVWVANDDGSGARRLVAGSSPKISPDGQTVVYAPNGEQAELRAIPASGGPTRRILRNLTYGPMAFSPDNTTVATTTGRFDTPQRLVLVDVATGTSRVIASGWFSGASFSPDGDRLVYGRAVRDAAFSPSDVWSVPVAGGAPQNLTRDGHSTVPVWGPTQVAYTRWSRPTGPNRKLGGPTYNLSLMNPDGTRMRRLTNDRVSYLLTGLTPTAWSADGTRLLAQFGGQDTAYAVTVDPTTGRERVLGPKGESGLVGVALSADGSTVLGTLGLLDEPGNVVTMPYAGGKPTVLARRANAPDWSGRAGGELADR